MKKFIIAIFLISAIPVLAFDFGAGRNQGMGGTILLSTPLASDLLICPGAQLVDKQILLESGFQRRYELKDLDRVFVAGGYRYRFIYGAIGYSQFGRSNYYAEKNWKGLIGGRYRWFSIAIVAGGNNREFGNGYGSYSMQSFGIGGGANLKRVYLGFLADNLNEPRLAGSSSPERANYSIFGEVEGTKVFSITARATMEKYEKPILALGQFVHLSGKNAIFWGVSGNPLTYGGGVELHYSFMVVDYAVSYHPVLGFSHNISLGYSGEK